MVTLPITYNSSAIKIKLMNEWNSLCVRPQVRCSRVWWGSTWALETETKQRHPTHNFLSMYLGKLSLLDPLPSSLPVRKWFFICNFLLYETDPMLPTLLGCFLGFKIGANDNAIHSSFLYAFVPLIRGRLRHRAASRQDQGHTLGKFQRQCLGLGSCFRVDKCME